MCCLNHWHPRSQPRLLPSQSESKEVTDLNTTSACWVVVEITVSVTAHWQPHSQLLAAHVPNRHPHEGVLLGIPNTRAVSLGKICHTEEERTNLPTPASLLEDSASPKPHIKSPQNSICCCNAERSEQRGAVVWKRQTAAISLF